MVVDGDTLHAAAAVVVVVVVVLVAILEVVLFVGTIGTGTGRAHGQLFALMTPLTAAPLSAAAPLLYVPPDVACIDNDP